MSGCSSPVSASPRTRREREEDGQHGAEEERAEHGQAEQGGARERARVEAELVVAEAGDVLEQLAGAPRVEAAEGEREDHDDREHAPAQRLAQGVAGDDEDAGAGARRSAGGRSALVRPRSTVGLHDGQIGVLERRAHEADLVDALAGGDQALDDGRHLVAGRALEALRAGLRLDLDAVRARQLVRAALGQQLAVVDDRHAVADPLDLAEQMGVEQHGDAAPAQLAEQVAHDPPPDRVERARGLVEQQQPRAADERLRDARGAAACPSTSCSTRRPPSSPSPTSASSSARSAAPPVEPDRRWCRCSSSSALAQPGKRKSSAR